MNAMHAGCLGTALSLGALLAGSSSALAQDTVIVESSPPPLQILGSFIFPETRQAVTIAGSDGAPALSFRVMPTKVARGSGIVAFGEF